MTLVASLWLLAGKQSQSNNAPGPAIYWLFIGSFFAVALAGWSLVNNEVGGVIAGLVLAVYGLRETLHSYRATQERRARNRVQ